MSRIDDMKRAISSYRDTKQKADARLEEVRTYYGEEAGKREQERLNKQLKTEREKAVSVISNAYSEGVYQVEQWGKLDGSRLTDDAKLLDANLVGPEDFETLKGKYRDNNTMLTALKKYGDRKNAEAAQEARSNGRVFAMGDPYNTRDIATVTEKMENWKHAKAQALDVLDMIDGTGRYTDPWAQALGRNLGPEVIEHFGEGESF